jgi:hypothetical protein
MRKLLLGLALVGATAGSAQILSVTPAFPTQNDSVTIVYNAAQGNGALVGTTPVYIDLDVAYQLAVCTGHLGAAYRKGADDRFGRQRPPH